MTVYAYNKVAVYAEFAGTLRLARSTRVFVTDAVTGDPVNVTQGIVVQPYLDTDTAGIASFTAEHPGPLQLRSGTVFVDAYSDELPGIALDAVAAAEAAQAAAEAAAAAAYGPADGTVATLVGTSSATRTALDARYVMDTDTIAISHGGTGQTTAAAALAALGGDPLSQSGTYASRPAANTVAAGTIYYATDIPEQYRSNGIAWSVVGSGGNELGYTQITSTGVAQGPTAAAVPGLSVTFTAGERPVIVEFASLFQVASSGIYVIATIKLGVDSVGSTRLSTTVATQYVSLGRPARLTGLTPGASYTVTVQIGTDSGTVTPFASATNPIWLQVRTL